MAYVNTTRVAHISVADRIMGLVDGFRKMQARRAIYRQTLRELNALSGRELADLGIHRSMITRLAQEAAYGK
ncbi:MULTISPECIES: DUF1127 domain-containing protein [Gemmobacter]|jgi:uncharacterized protein YjiS (DUF1127 family)|uniref:Uncharacterized protein DUF1127 n=2 Tax=Gemmobacter TaxID=204456 RepID=A0A2T6AYW1_9RHOB|nr:MULTISPECIES: DUF1127 domain-containing protein [Gemmobacter]OJY35200.1 MAG: hypothetical protein BGP11_00590 [Rhodobacterales bacterium 65-51]PTX48998.1 uncharacterized protein DUF1127 [Gemmobacter caeni]TWI99001.1 uncharacterized protein DUF1127 [Gemmobacter caeni]GHC31607.1 hypothetical protein GCM10007291_35590 [Gemmobacter nanjingensis]